MNLSIRIARSPETYTLSLHDALPIYPRPDAGRRTPRPSRRTLYSAPPARRQSERSEEHTSELQSRQYLVCRLLLEKKNEWFRGDPLGAGKSTEHMSCRTNALPFLLSVPYFPRSPPARYRKARRHRLRKRLR